jgi:hypothetical protein
VEEKRNAQNIFDLKFENRRHFGDLTANGKIILKWNL